MNGRHAAYTARSEIAALEWGTSDQPKPKLEELIVNINGDVTRFGCVNTVCKRFKWLCQIYCVVCWEQMMTLPRKSSWKGNGFPEVLGLD